MTFLDSVNRILRITGIIRGDTDTVTSFSDLQHGSTLNLAIIAVQDTLTDLTSDYDFPSERASSTITFVTNTRAYSLASDFVQFWQSEQTLYDSVNNRMIYEYPGGEKQLSDDIWTYQSDTGSPIYYYYIEGSTKQLGFYQIPDSTQNGIVLSYDYEKDIIPTTASETMPFIRDIETYSFCQLASIRFQVMFTANPKEQSTPVEQNPQYIDTRATLLKLINPKKPNRYYGSTYC